MKKLLILIILKFNIQFAQDLPNKFQIQTLQGIVFSNTTGYRSDLISRGEYHPYDINRMFVGYSNGYRLLYSRKIFNEKKLNIQLGYGIINQNLRLAIESPSLNPQADYPNLFAKIRSKNILIGIHFPALSLKKTKLEIGFKYNAMLTKSTYEESVKYSFVNFDSTIINPKNKLDSSLIFYPYPAYVDYHGHILETDISLLIKISNKIKIKTGISYFMGFNNTAHIISSFYKKGDSSLSPLLNSTNGSAIYMNFSTIYEF